MELTLENFTTVIDSKILQRGRDYARGGYVAALGMQDDGIWVALVAGTEDYDVMIEQQANGTLICSCTCPYDLGPYCKHVAAVLFAILEAFPDSTSKATARAGAAKRKQKSNRLADALQQAAHEDLVAALLELAQQDRQIANQLALRFGALDEDKSSYSKLVKDALRAHSDRGFLDYRGSIAAAKAVSELIARADQLLERGMFDSALACYQAVMETVVEALNSADDSNGSLGGCIAQAVMGVERAAAAATPTQRKQLFDLCLEQAVRLKDWDWGWDLFELAASLLDTPEQRTKLFALMDNFNKNTTDALRALAKGTAATMVRTHISTFDAERASMIQLSVIERQDGEQAAEKFIAERIHLDRLRQLWIDRLLKRRAYDEARRLALEAIQVSSKRGLPGLALQYQQMLLDAAQLENDVPAIIEVARLLLVSGRGDRANHYGLLKKHVDVSAWNAQVESLLNEAEKHRLDDLFMWICAQEGLWRKILVQAKSGWGHAVDPYRKELEQRFPDEVAQIYEHTARAMLRQASSRDMYAAACEFLRRIKQMGLTEQVNKAVADLKTQYRQRRALVDELNQI